jgi:hypothetical protein
MHNTINVENLKELSNIQLEIQLIRESNFLHNFEKLIYKLERICKDESDLSIEDLIKHLKSSASKVHDIKTEINSRKK